ncbi:MAG TPA: discoidin domain-containing protein [Chthoniobacter sp.]|jgi:mono/diheme cytochrome c family protein
MKSLLLPAFTFLVLTGLVGAEDQPKYEPDFSAKPPVPVLSPEEELKTIQLPEGYSLELVLSERDGIKEPVAIAFDGNGRMYLAEMRTYMQDIDGNNEHDPMGVVSRHESTKGDDHFDKHTIFADKLVLPREVLPLDDRVLINETDSNDIYSYRDTKGTGVADKKELWFAGGARGGNLEHQQSGLIWCLDNWIYQSTANYRLRWNGANQALQEKCPSGGGQWGLAQDDYGKIWWSNAGGEKGLWHFQTPIIYGAYDLSGQMPADFNEVWPLLGLADYQGGPGRVRVPDKTLNHFTASCGQQVVRGDRLPQDLRGDVLISEPVGRLIRRAKVEVKDGITTISNPYGHSEFIRSTDPNFRIVNMANGPDGCLYLVDMYRGIIQEGTWCREGSYLRKVIQQYGMDKVVGHGRIWRLRYRGLQPGPQPHMLDESPAQLVSHLTHPNGWWRDTAQKLLVVKGDKSVVPALVQMASSNSNELARIHALWTLEGLDSADAGLVRKILKDSDPKIRAEGLRVAERLIEKGDASLRGDVQALAHDPDVNVIAQVLMTGKLLNSLDQKLWPDYSKFAQATLLTSPSLGLKSLGMVILSGSDKIGGPEFNAAQIAVLEKGRDIYKEVCFACHGFDGKGMPMDGPKPGLTIGPPLGGAQELRAHPDAAVKVLLSGLAGPIGGKKYDAQMVPMNTNDDAWIAAVASYVRNAFGNHGAMVAPEDVKHLREQSAARKEPWTVDTLLAGLPHPLKPVDWKVTASENQADIALLTDGRTDNRWKTQNEQKSGQWIQVELPQETKILGVRLDQSRASGDYPNNWRVEGSLDGHKWTRLTEGHGLPGASELYFKAANVKLVKLTLTNAQRGKPWSVCELELIAPPAETRLTSTP